MAFAYQKLCTHTPALKKYKLRFALLLALAWGMTHCGQPDNQTRMELSQLDSLVQELNRHHETLQHFQTDSIRKTANRIEYQLKSGYWQQNTVALQSLNDASFFVSELPEKAQMLANLIQKAEADVKLLQKAREKQALPQGEESRKLTALKAHLTESQQHIEFVNAKYEAILLLVETLEQDRAKHP